MNSRYSHLSVAERRRILEDRLPSLFDPPPPPVVDVPSLSRTTDPTTSHEAAAMGKVKRGSERHRLLAAFARHGPLTDDEASKTAGVEYYEGRRRCVDLRRHGLIAPTGQKRTSIFGNRAMVSAITPDGNAALAVAGRVSSHQVQGQ